MLSDFYDKWGTKELKDTSRNYISKWKAVNIANLYFRTLKDLKFDSICEVGGAEGIVINTIADLIGISNRTVYDVSESFCNFGTSIYPDTKYINNYFDENVNEKYGITVLSDITEHVPDDYKLLHDVSKKSEYVFLKMPIEKCLMYNKIFYLIRHRKRLPENLRYGEKHNNGHLRGYTLSYAKKLVSKYFNILDYEESDVLYFYGSNSQLLLRKILGKNISIKLFGGALFVLGKSKNI